jgi:SpoIVB peptidase S55
MKIRPILAILAIVALGSSALPATSAIMPIAEVKPGMTGVGRTVFQGAELQDFKVHILGVLRNIQGPGRNLILARLEGGPLAETGVAAGMSGSPVYVDGRLVGAVSYSIGAFPKEPIAGITPIEEMKDATQMGRRASTQQAGLELPVTPESLAAAMTASLGHAGSFAARAADVQVFGLPAASGAELGRMLRPIATPLVMSGFEPEAIQLFTRMLGDAGFTPMAGGGFGGGQGLPALKGPLREGDAVGVSLVGGDLEMGATGTVTHIDGDRVYAFGHPFFSVGPAQFPMTRAYVYGIVPSLASSFKIATMGDVIGTIRQDRATAIAGTLGGAPAVVPMRVTLTSAREDLAATTRTFNFQVATDQTFTPLLSYVTLFNTLAAYERQFGAATFAVRSRAHIKGHGDLLLDDVFTGDNSALGAATAIAGPLTLLLANDREPITVDGLDISLESTEASRSARIERVWLDDARPRAGRTVPLKVLTRSFRGEETISTVPIEIPANVSGPLSILVTDGKQLNASEARELRRTVQPQSVAQIIRVLNDTRRNNRIYVRLLAGAPGAVVNGEALTSLPPSVLAVLEGDGNGGSFAPIRSAPVGEWELPMDSAVIGSRLLAIDVEGRSPAGR